MRYGPGRRRRPGPRRTFSRVTARGMVKAMAQDDWAVVVGIKVYPELSDLDGPENDARAFYDWLVKPDGGGVPKDHVKLILSSDFQPPPQSATDAKPTAELIEEAFSRLDDEANKPQNNGRVGRRLYLYLSGHGFAPDFEQVALLMANANRNRTVLHILGKAYADWFYRAGYFQEVVLFMDCCQEKYRKTIPRPIHFNERDSPGGLDDSRRFYGFGTKWSKLAQERLMEEDGKVHGVFTTALLKGLAGAAADPATGKITAGSLAGWLYDSMPRLLSPDALSDPDVAREPDLDYDKKDEMTFVLATPTEVPSFKVRIHVPAASVGKRLIVRDDRFARVVELPSAAAITEVSLPRRMYLVEIPDDNLEEKFEVTGIGEEDVNF